MYSPSNQIQSPDDEEDEEENQLEDGDNSMIKDSAIKEAAVQETFLSYYNHHFVRTQDFTLKSLVAHNQQCPDFVSSVAVSTPSLKMRAKKRKSPAIDVHGGGGGRYCADQHSVRKDRHSKVRTVRGPRDRRVRLSPTTAIQFYDVQDRLGYDRPSKAIDWLIKEAKAAIDALNEHPNAAEIHRLPISKHGGFFISEGDDPVSGFGFSVDAVAPSSPPEFQAYMDQDFNASRNGSEASEDVIFYPSDHQQEFLDLQKMLSCNFGIENSGNPRGGGGRRGAEYPPLDSPPHLSPAPPISGDRPMFSHREPLQSSFINYSPINGNFPAFDFDNELSNITASATLKEDGTDKKLVSSRPFSSDPFLHYED